MIGIIDYYDLGVVLGVVELLENLICVLVGLIVGNIVCLGYGVKWINEFGKFVWNVYLVNWDFWVYFMYNMSVFYCNCCFFDIEIIFLLVLMSINLGDVWWL